MAAPGAGLPCRSGWSRFVEREARAAPVAQPAARTERAPLHAAAPIDDAASIHQYAQFTVPAFGDPPIEPGAALGPHAALDVMANLPVLVHCDESASSREFVPAEL